MNENPQSPATRPANSEFRLPVCCERAISLMTKFDNGALNETQLNELNSHFVACPECAELFVGLAEMEMEAIELRGEELLLEKGAEILEDMTVK